MTDKDSAVSLHVDNVLGISLCRHQANIQRAQVDWTLWFLSQNYLKIKRGATFVRESMFVLDQNIWWSSITLEAKLLLYNACILPIFYMAMRPLSQQRKLMHWIIVASDVFCISSGRILSLMTWFGVVQISYSCQKKILSVDVTCLSVIIFVVPTPVNTVTPCLLELFRPAFRVLPRLAM